MKIKFIVIGKTTESYIKQGIEDYCKRLSNIIDFELVVINDVKNSTKLPVEKLKEEEGKEIVLKISDYKQTAFVLLDEQGKQFTSPEMAKFITNKSQSYASLCFIIGGAYGFSELVYNHINEKIALSKMTFTHQMVRLFFIEQLYRAIMINRGSKYHH